jgi:manganese-dependent ADP-ribose/CDP-alcohol diphosphatase
MNKEEEEEDDNYLRVPIASFGVITDIQYADVDDGASYNGKRIRHYRNSLNLTTEAINNWIIYESEQNKKLEFVIQLGDLVDFRTQNSKDINADQARDLIYNQFSRLFPNDLNRKLLHIWGNHEMYNWKRSDLLENKMNTARQMGQQMNANGNYFTIGITSKLKMICLDFYEFSAIGYNEDDQTYKEAIEILLKHNKNDDLNSPIGLRGHAQRFTKYNGNKKTKHHFH